MKKALLFALSLAVAVVTSSASTPPAGSPTPTSGKLVKNMKAKDFKPCEGRTMLPSPSEKFESLETVNPTYTMKAPAYKPSLSGATFQGWMAPTDQEPGGWYSVSTDGTYTHQWSNKLTEIGINLTNGWIKNNRLCGLASFTSGAMVMYYNYVELDLKDGHMLVEEGITDDGYIHLANYFITSTYVPSTGRVYGYTYANDNGQGYCFASSPVDQLDNITYHQKLDDNTTRATAICYNPEENCFYAVCFNGNFVKIDLEGNQTVLFKLPLENLRSDPSALVYSPLDGCFIYIAYYYNYASQMYFIYPDRTEHLRFVRNFPDANEFFFLETENNYDASAPGRPELLNYTLNDGVQSGELTFRLPSTKGNGETLTGELEWTLYIDNASYKTGNAEAGSEITVPVNDLERGEHVFRLACKAGGSEGLSCVETRFIGSGKPLAPANVQLTEGKVTWDAVTKADLDAYLDLSKMEYDVYLNDRFLGTTASTEYTFELDKDKEIVPYYAYVAARCAGLTSEKTQSNKIIAGKPYSLPYTLVPTKEQSEICQVVNLDGSPDYGIWQYWETRWHEPVFASGWNQTRADDWLILPAVDCSDISHAYRLTLDAICGGHSGKDERFEVWCGNAPTVEAMNTLIIPETQVSKFITEGWNTFSNLFVPRSAGPCYIAIHCVSPAEQYSLLIRRVKIESTDEVADVPCAPTDMKVLSSSDADLTATVSFTMPTQTIAGKTISPEDDVKAVLKCGTNTVEQKAAPGETVTMTIATFQGDNRVEAVCTLNGQSGQSSSVTLFTGTIPPNFVENLRASVTEDNMGIKLTWQAPLGGQENMDGYYSPKGMHYWLYEVKADEYGESRWTPSLDLGDVNEYTFRLPDNASLQLKYVAIVAANEAGLSQAVSYAYREIGKPYGCNIEETLRGGQVHYLPLRILTPTQEYADQEWIMIRPEDVNDDFWAYDIPYMFMGYMASEDENATNGRARLSLPKFSTENVENPVVEMKLRTGSQAAQYSVYAQCYDTDGKYEVIFNVPAMEDDWSTVTVALPEKFRNKKWVSVALDGLMANVYTYTMLGGYRFCPGSESGISDICISADGNIRATAGAITFEGFEEGKSATVYALDGKAVKTVRLNGKQVSTSIAPGVYVVECAGKQAKLVVR